MCTRTTVLAIVLAGIALLWATFPATTSRAAGDAEKGRATFLLNCVTCHGETGKGDGPVGKALDPPPRDFSTAEFKFDADGNGTAGEDADLEQVIKKGAGAFGGSPLMAPWAHLPQSEIDDLIAFIRTLQE